jgi:hypothetical protein
MLVEYWLSFPDLVGDISCTSLITRIADDLGILGDATIIDIDTPREIIDYDYFRQGRWVKRIQEKLHYIHNKNAILLPNPRLGIYSVQSFLINEQAQPVQHNLHEHQLEPHRQTTPELAHCPKMLRIDHMKTSCQHTLIARTKEEIYHHKDRATSEDKSLEVAGFTHHLRILYLPVTLFQDSAISILQCSAKESMTT